MGLPIQNLKATNINDETGWILLSKYTPVKKENGKYYMPDNTPLFEDMFVPNCFDLKEEEGTVYIEIVKSKEETGLWLICYDDYFGNEQHLYSFKPKFKEGTKRLDYKYIESLEEELGDRVFGLHVDTNIKMKAGDGPIPVTLIRK